MCIKSKLITSLQYVYMSSAESDRKEVITLLEYKWNHFSLSIVDSLKFIPICSQCQNEKKKKENREEELLCIESCSCKYALILEQTWVLKGAIYWVFPNCILRAIIVWQKPIISH